MSAFMLTGIHAKDAGKAFASCFARERADFLVAMSDEIDDWEYSEWWDEACKQAADEIPEDKREAVKDKLVTLVNMIWEKELGNAD